MKQTPQDPQDQQDDQDAMIPVEDLELKISELTADLQRVHADFVNFKRRSEEDQDRVSDMAKVGIIMKFLPFFDTVERALEHIPEELQGNTWTKGIVQVSKQFESILKDLGVTRIEALDKPFDPNLHEAVSMDESGEGEEVVIEELQPGYMVNGFVIRHSMVKVGRR